MSTDERTVEAKTPVLSGDGVVGGPASGSVPPVSGGGATAAAGAAVSWHEKAADAGSSGARDSALGGDRRAGAVVSRHGETAGSGGEASNLGAATPMGEGPGGALSGAGARSATWRATLRLFRSEVGLIFRRPRTVAMLVVVAVVPVLCGVAIRIFGADGEALMAQVAGNGLALGYVAFSIMTPLILPLVVAVVAGDALAGEAGLGTLRYLLTAPAGRTRLLGVKFAGIAAFALATSLVIVLAALVTGLLLFPVGPVTLLSGTTVPLLDGLLRIGLITLYVTLGMIALGTLALAVSSFTDAAIGAIVTTVVLVLVSQILAFVPQLDVISPYLLTSWFQRFDGALREPLATGDMGQGVLAFAAYIAIFGSIAWARFTSRDITA
ncbi:ABC transporter permease [Herbidospora mongoliensis]|uniref:ABC transporter permease n=1 Tax=Herbidospora mongoliensis TaxID=688067 RepID=UPI000A6C6137|nr:ABC transporter permease [Herbidospora mongoliensis]